MGLDHIKLHSSELLIVLHLVRKIALSKRGGCIGYVVKSSDCERLLQHVRVKELLSLCSFTLNTQQLLTLRNVLKGIGQLLTLLSIFYELENEPRRLQKHHGIITFVGWDRATLRENLGKARV